MLHGIQDFKVHIYFGRIGTNEQYSFELFEPFLQSVNPGLEKSLGDRMVYSPESVSTTVNAVAIKLSRPKGKESLREMMRFLNDWREFFGGTFVQRFWLITQAKKRIRKSRFVKKSNGMALTKNLTTIANWFYPTA